MVKKTKTSQKKPDRALAIIGLIINIFILPGLGSIIGGKVKPGVWQLIIFLGAIIIGIPLSFIIIGIPILIIGVMAAWIWGIVTGVQLVEESS